MQCTGMSSAGRLRYKPADADTGSAQSEAASDHKTTKNSNAEYTSEVFAMDTYMTLTAYGENAKEAVEAGDSGRSRDWMHCCLPEMRTVKWRRSIKMGAVHCLRIRTIW
mgnify:CR=1 FL=1